MEYKQPVIKILVEIGFEVLITTAKQLLRMMKEFEDGRGRSRPLSIAYTNFEQGLLWLKEAKEEAKNSSYQE
jgi:hypothetical protein